MAVDTASSIRASSLVPQSDVISAAAVDAEACKRLAELIATQPIPADREEASLQNFAPRTIGNFYFLLVAICHQTSPRGRAPLEGIVASTKLRGWDYLSAKLEVAARENTALLTPEAWAAFDPVALLEIFRDPEYGNRLTDPQGRASLIRDLGEGMLRSGWHWVDEISELCGHRIATGFPNLLGVLSSFRAYNDPVHKKAYFFLALMRNAGIWRYADDSRLGPPVDYHEVRGHLRIGTVQIHDPILRSKLLGGVPVSAAEDVAIRKAVHDAIMLISELTGIRNPSRLHYLFWNVFRSCCTRESPHCQHCPPQCSLPPRYIPLSLQPDGTRRCPFSSVCESAGRQRKLLEHVFETDYY